MPVVVHCTNKVYTVVRLGTTVGKTIMQYPEASYLNRPVGAQLLRHYAHRDAVRRATPLLPSFTTIATTLVSVSALFRRRPDTARQ